MNLKAIIDSRKDELFEILSSLIKIDSQSNGIDGKEKEIAFYIADFLKEMGIEPDVYCPLDIPGFDSHPDRWEEHNLKGRYNVSAIIPGKDHSRRIMLAGHNDTVAIGNIDNWTVDPFGGEIKDGKIWGRGACDDKYSIATVLFLIKVFRDENIEFPIDVVFTAYCNEEYGGSHGALAACLKYPCDEVISLDCKNFEIWNCAIGGGEMKLHIKAKSPASDCEVIHEGLRFVVDEFRKFRKRREAELLSEEEYKKYAFVNECVKFLEIRAGNQGNDLDRGHVEVCYYATSTEDVINAEFNEMTDTLNEKLAPLNLEVGRIEKTTRYFHFEKTAKGSPAMKALMDAAEKSTGRTLVPIGACQSDLSMFLRYGSKNAFAFGIGRPFGEYGGAHQADEHIECDNLLEFANILAQFLAIELN